MRSQASRRPTADRSQAGEQLRERLCTTPEWAALRTLALFVGRSDEIDSLPLLQEALGQGLRVLLPRVTDEARGELAFFAIEDPAALEVGAFGILEPSPEARPAALAEADWVLVPGLAFDRCGGRLGRGAGYYDRALVALPEGRWGPSRRPLGRPWILGIGFDAQVVDPVPMEPHDVRLDAVVTERGWYDARVGLAAAADRSAGDEG